MSSSDSAIQQCGALYVAHHSWLLGWLRYKLGCMHDAADLAQDTFVRVLTSRELQADQQLQEPRAFLLTVAGRLVSNHFRRRSLEHAWLETLAALPEQQVPSPEVQASLLQSLNEIDLMLDGLAPRVRQAFLLAQLEGLTYAKIAERLGISVRTVKRYMAEAYEQCIMLSL